MAFPTLFERAEVLRERLNIPASHGWWAFSDTQCENASHRLEVFENVSDRLPWVARTAFELRGGDSQVQSLALSSDAPSIREISNWLERPGHAVVLTLDFLGKSLDPGAHGAAKVYERALYAWVSRSVGDSAIVGFSVDKPIYGHSPVQGNIAGFEQAKEASSRERSASDHELQILRVPTPALRRILAEHDDHIRDMLAIFCEKYEFLGAVQTSLRPAEAHELTARTTTSLSPSLHISRPLGTFIVYRTPIPESVTDATIRQFMTSCRCEIDVAIEPCFIPAAQGDALIERALGPDNVRSHPLFDGPIIEHRLYGTTDSSVRSFVLALHTAHSLYLAIFQSN
jgi:hypothetical protein